MTREEFIVALLKSGDEYPEHPHDEEIYRLREQLKRLEKEKQEDMVTAWCRNNDNTHLIDYIQDYCYEVEMDFFNGRFWERSSC